MNWGIFQDTIDMTAKLAGIEGKPERSSNPPKREILHLGDFSMRDTGFCHDRRTRPRRGTKFNFPLQTK